MTDAIFTSDFIQKILRYLFQNNQQNKKTALYKITVCRKYEMKTDIKSSLKNQLK